MPWLFHDIPRDPLMTLLLPSIFFLRQVTDSSPVRCPCPLGRDPHVDTTSGHPDTPTPPRIPTSVPGRCRLSGKSYYLNSVKREKTHELSDPPLLYWLSQCGNEETDALVSEVDPEHTVDFRCASLDRCLSLVPTSSFSSQARVTCRVSCLEGVLSLGV